MFSFDYVKDFDPEVAKAMEDELGRQRNNLELIASENLVSEAVMAAMGSHLTNKYAEGYPGKRYYGGCQYVDVVENLAIERAKELFGCEYVNIQPHSGAQANMAVFFAVMNLGKKGNYIRKFLTEPEYLPILQKQEKHLIKIKRQAIVQKGNLRYIPPPDRLDRRRERDLL